MRAPEVSNYKGRTVLSRLINEHISTLILMFVSRLDMLPSELHAYIEGPPGAAYPSLHFGMRLITELSPVSSSRRHTLSTT